MATFDIAVRYLEDIDFKHFDLNSDSNWSIPEKKDVSNEEKALREQIKMQHFKFEMDKENNVSNGTYRGMVFTAVMYHFIFMAKGLVSPFDVACEIVDSERGILNTDFKTYRKTAYPEVMTNKWSQYCDSLLDKTSILDGELGWDILFVAFDYVIEYEKS